MQKAASNTCKTITVSHSAIRHFLTRLHSLVTAVAAGISVALTVLTAGAAATAIASKSPRRRAGNIVFPLCGQIISSALPAPVCRRACLIQRPKITRGYIAITAPDTKYQFQSIKTFIREVISSLGWKRYRWFVKYIAKGGDNLEAILRKQKRKDVIVQLLAIPEPYQHQDYMRQLMDFALQTAKSYDLPLVIETDEKLKCDKYGHFGVKQVNKRDFGDDRYGYGMICEN